MNLLPATLNHNKDAQALAATDHRAATELLGERALSRGLAAYGTLSVIVAVGLGLGPLYGFQDADMSTLGHMAGMPFFTLLIAAFLLLVFMLFDGWKLGSVYGAARLRWLEALHGWRPRVGAPHPKGRTDTHDRFVIERVAAEAGVTARLVRYHYDGQCWQPLEWAGSQDRTFAPGEEDELVSFEQVLRAAVPGHETAAIEENATAQAEAEQLRVWHGEQVGAELVV